MNANTKKQIIEALEAVEHDWLDTGKIDPRTAELVVKALVLLRMEKDGTA